MAVKKCRWVMLSALFFAAVPKAFAHCPLCTIAAGAGVGFTRAIGIDDSIVGLFIGALIASSALWFNRWLIKKVRIPFQEFIVIFTSFLLTVIPLYLTGIITNLEIVKLSPASSLFGLGAFGLDRLMIGIIIGTIATWFSFRLSDNIKRIRRKVMWSYQSLSFMAIALIVLSAVFWWITK